MAFFGLFGGKKDKPLKESTAPKNEDGHAPRGHHRMNLSDKIFPGWAELKEQSFPFGNPDAGTEFDDRFFISLGEISPLDLPIERIQTAQRLSLLLYRKNPRAFRSIELTKDFVIGEGVRVIAEDPKVQEVLDEHWIENEWESDLGPRVAALGLFGEQVYPAFVRDGDGLVTLGEIPFFSLFRFMRDEENFKELVAIVARLHLHDGPADADAQFRDHTTRPYQVIRTTKSGKLSYFPKKNNTFYFAVNKISGAIRGLPDLLPSLDWLEGFDGFLFSLLERSDLATNVVFDIMYKGLKPAEIQDMVDQFNDQMRDGGTFGHNENVELEIKTPQLGANEAQQVSKLFLKQIYSGTGHPGLFFSDGDDLTRASAQELTIPVSKTIQARQMFVKMMLRKILQFQIERSVDAGVLQGVKNLNFEVVMSRIFMRDLSTVTTAITELTEALARGVERNWITNDAAGEIYKTSLEQLGPLPTNPKELPAQEKEDGVIPEEEEKGGTAA